MTGALLLLGCDPGEREDARVEPVDGATTARTGPASVAPRRGRLIAGERITRIPRWPAASTIDGAARERLSPAARAAVARSQVPVLVPGDPGWIARAQVFTPTEGPGWGYALSARRGDVNIAVHASRIATLLPGVGPIRGNHRLRAVDGFLGVNDGIRTASWIEHGVAYSLDLECFDPEGPECSEAALRAAVEGLVYVGGAGGGS